MSALLLVVEGELDAELALAPQLSAAGHDVRSVGGEDILGALVGAEPDVAVVDGAVAAADGFRLLRMVRERAPRVRVLVVLGSEPLAIAMEALRHGAAELIWMPFTIEEICRVVARLAEERHAKNPRECGVNVAQGPAWEDFPTGTLLPPLIGEHPSMRQLRHRVVLAANSGATLLITGETGSGKEIVARQVHLLSRPEAPFVALNCGSLARELVLSAMFGHERGAFTGADKAHRGVFEFARRGTLFLDEIGDLLFETHQPALLRALQERVFTRIGGEKLLPFEARLVTATNKDLSVLVRAGEFRRDLFYRIAVLHVTTVPLREHLSDIPLLAEHLLQKIAEREGHPSPHRIRPAALEKLMDHDWPGNVRELENCLDRAVSEATSGVIHPVHIRTDGQPNVVTAPAPGKAWYEGCSGGTPATKGGRRAAPTGSAVEAALARNHGVKSWAAEDLAIGRPSLDKLIKEYGIDVAAFRRRPR